MTYHNIHNNFCQHFWSHAEVIEAYLRNCSSEALVLELDFSTLREEKTDFLPSKYRNSRRADALWSLKTFQGEEIAVHLEHQSTPNPAMAARLLEYQAAYIRHQLQVNGASKIPTILSLVIYHGKRTWTGPKSIADLFTRPDLYVKEGLYPDFVVNLNEQPLKKLQKFGAAALPSIILANQPSGDMCRSLNTIAPFLKSTHTCCKRASIEYMATIDKHGAKFFLEELRKFDQETAEKFGMMFEQAIEKTKREFLHLGIREGRREAIQQAVLGMHSVGVSIELIAKGTRLSKKNCMLFWTKKLKNRPFKTKGGA